MYQYTLITVWKLLDAIKNEEQLNYMNIVQLVCDQSFKEKRRCMVTNDRLLWLWLKSTKIFFIKVFCLGIASHYVTKVFGKNLHVEYCGLGKLHWTQLLPK